MSWVRLLVIAVAGVLRFQPGWTRTKHSLGAAEILGFSEAGPAGSTRRASRHRRTSSEPAGRPSTANTCSAASRSISTGLPPTPGEVDLFLADKSPDAYEKVVDRLIASPQYGERWAQRWLDVVRYADTNGYELDAERPHAWRYRDYVVRSFNRTSRTTASCASRLPATNYSRATRKR